MKLSIYLSLIILLVHDGYSQRQNLEQKLRTAEYYEQIQDWENALVLYKELFKTDSMNVVLFESLLRTYDHLKMYDEAISIIGLRLKFRPQDIDLLSQLGKMYARNGDSKKAIEIWNRAIDVDNKNISFYTIVANEMIESRMIEQAIKVYQRGRSIIGDKNVFAAELGYLNSIFMNYREATEEYLLLIKQSPLQLGFVQSRLSTYTGKAEGLSAAINVVEGEQKIRTESVTIQQLLAWLYMEGKNYGKAFFIYKSIDEKIKASGREIYNFAERVLREKAYSTAAKAFAELINNYPKSFAIDAKFGYARTLEEASADEEAPTLFGELRPFKSSIHKLKLPEPDFKPTYSNALEAYNKLISEYPKTEYAAKSLYRMAFIYYYVLYDFKNAESSLQQIEKYYGNFIPILIESSALLGKVYLSDGDLDKSNRIFQWLRNYNNAAANICDRAKYSLAEIDFYKGNFKDALNQLQTLTQNPVSEIANDALSLQIFIQENEHDGKTLTKFSQAMLLKSQRQFESAAQLFLEIIRDNPKSDLSEEALMNTGDIYSAMNRFTEAITMYDKLINDFPESIILDKSQMKIGAVYQFGLRDNSNAINAYQKLLEKFRNSIYLNEARRRIRELRGDVL
jgi:tetratricopeptide (TPR) repeat protein